VDKALSTCVIGIRSADMRRDLQNQQTAQARGARKLLQTVTAETLIGDYECPRRRRRAA
jgi:hypothetical protein